MDILDLVANDPAFSVAELTESISRAEFVPMRLGEIGLFQQSNISKTVAAIDQKNRTVSLVPSRQRGAPPNYDAGSKSKLIYLPSVRLPLERVILPESLQNIRPTDANAVDQVAAIIAEHQIEMRQKLEATLEFHRLGAVKGRVLDSNGDELLDLFDEFGVNQPSEVAFNLTVNENGAVRSICTAIVRAITTALGQIPFRGVHCMCSDSFWDALIANKEVRATYLAQSEASQLREGTAYSTLSFGGITFENYRGMAAGVPYIAADKAHFFPVGAPGVFRQYGTPGDDFRWLGIGQSQLIYSGLKLDNKRIEVEAESCPITMCTVPEVLIQGKLGA